MNFKKYTSMHTFFVWCLHTVGVIHESPLRYKVFLKKSSLFLIILFTLSSACTKPKQFNTQYAQRVEQEGWSKVEIILDRITPPIFPETSYNVNDFGAKGDSISNDLPAFQSAIDACSENGGGRVVVSSGEYFLKGPIKLKSNVHLNLKEGARIFFSQQADDYLPAVKVRWEGTVCYNYSPLIYGYQLTNVAITGKGLIDGAAQEWSSKWREMQKPDKKRLRQMGNDTIPEMQRVFANGFLDLDGDGNDDGFGDGKPHYLRPTLLELYECQNILLEGFTIKKSPFWTVHPVFSKNITIKNLKIKGSVLNDDGIDPDSCEDVLIEGCEITTRDDAISIKAGRDQDAWHRQGSKNIIIRKNKLMSGANALCIGSEMSGGVQYVFVEDNSIANGQHALNFKCNLDRGGQVEKVFIRNIEIESCRDAMFIFRMDYHGYRGNNFPTKFNDFYVSGITCKRVEKRPFKIVGVPDQLISRIYLGDITVEKAGEDSKFEFVNDIVLQDVKVNNKPLQKISNK